MQIFVIRFCLTSQHVNSMTFIGFKAATCVFYGSLNIFQLTENNGFAFSCIAAGLPLSRYGGDVTRTAHCLSLTCGPYPRQSFPERFSRTTFTMTQMPCVLRANIQIQCLSELFLLTVTLQNHGDCKYVDEDFVDKTSKQQILKR